MRVFRLMFVVLSLAALIGCGYFGKSSPRLAPAVSPDQATVGFHKGQRAPEIVGQDADGHAMRLSDYRGKVVVLDFWATW